MYHYYFWRSLVQVIILNAMSCSKVCVRWLVWWLPSSCHPEARAAARRRRASGRCSSSQHNSQVYFTEYWVLLSVPHKSLFSIPLPQYHDMQIIYKQLLNSTGCQDGLFNLIYNSLFCPLSGFHPPPLFLCSVLSTGLSVLYMPYWCVLTMVKAHLPTPWGV